MRGAPVGNGPAWLRLSVGGEGGVDGPPSRASGREAFSLPARRLLPAFPSSTPALCRGEATNHPTPCPAVPPSRGAILPLPVQSATGRPLGWVATLHPLRGNAEARREAAPPRLFLGCGRPPA